MLIWNLICQVLGKERRGMRCLFILEFSPAAKKNTSEALFEDIMARLMKGVRLLLSL